MGAVGLINFLGAALFHWLKARPEMASASIPVQMEMVLAFGEASLPWMLGLAGIFTGAGGYALLRPIPGVRVLAVAAWLTAGLLVALTVVWSIEVARAELGLAFHALGIVLHGIQIVLVVRAAQFFGKDAVYQDVVRHGQLRTGEPFDGA